MQKSLFWYLVCVRKVVQNPTLIKKSSDPIAIKIFQEKFPTMMTISYAKMAARGDPHAHDENISDYTTTLYMS